MERTSRGENNKCKQSTYEVSLRFFFKLTELVNKQQDTRLIELILRSPS